jgi:hypothetical protein
MTTAPYRIGDAVTVCPPATFTPGYAWMLAYAGLSGTVAGLVYHMETETIDRWTHLRIQRHRKYDSVTVQFDPAATLSNPTAATRDAFERGNGRATFPLAWVEASAPVMIVRSPETADRVLARLDAATAPNHPAIDAVAADWTREACPFCGNHGPRTVRNTTRSGLVLIVCPHCQHADPCEHADIDRAQVSAMFNPAPAADPWPAPSALTAFAALAPERHPAAVAADVADADALIGMLYPEQPDTTAAVAALTDRAAALTAEIDRELAAMQARRAPSEDWAEFDAATHDAAAAVEERTRAEYAATLERVTDLAARMAAQPPGWDDADKAATAQPAIDNLAAVLEHPALALTADHLTAAGDHAALWTWADQAIVLTESIRALAASNPPGNIHQARNRWLSAWNAAHSLIGRFPETALARKGAQPYALACLACGALSGDLSAVDHPSGPVVALCGRCLDAARYASATTPNIPAHILSLIHLTADQCVTVRPCSDCGAFLPAFATGPAQCDQCRSGDTAYFRTRYGRALTANELTALETPAAPAR